MLQVFEKRIMKIFIGLLHEVAAVSGANISDIQVRLPFVKLAYTLGGYVPTMGDVYVENRSSKEREELLRKLQWPFTTESFGAPGEKRNRFFQSDSWRKR